ncbi:hypothetical protein EDM68_05675 [Candidatus Uhrbacteria bacterium]|nr:MAG: hypothetical protein EDM68_05675 [Candidatus Uhrbacteria bacterium]
MTHADLDHRINEVLWRGTSGSLLIDRLNNAFIKAGVPDRIETLDDVSKLSEPALRAALARLSHTSYDRDPDEDRRRAEELVRKAS